MKNKTLKTIIKKHALQQRIRPTETFWSECQQRAKQQSNTTPFVFPSSSSRKIKGIYPAFASLASAAALVILYFSLNTAPETRRSINSFKFGETLAHNGAVVLNDTATDATILWIMTNDTEEDTQ